MAKIVTELVNLKAKEYLCQDRGNSTGSLRITTIKGHYRARQGNNSEIVAALIILRRLEQQVECSENKHRHKLIK